MRHWNDAALSVKPAFFIATAAAIVLLPVKWVVAWIVASVVHESFHLFAIRIMRLRVLSVTLGGNGAIIVTESMHPLQELICALAGPFGGLTLLLLIRHTPILSICALVQSLFNLLPYYPLDGGRALYNFLLLSIGEVRSRRITARINTIIIVLLGTFSVILRMRYRYGVVAMCLTLLLFFRNRKSNYALQTASSDSTI